MNNLIRAEFYKQKINGIFVMYLIMFLVGITISLSCTAAPQSANSDWLWCYNNLLSNSMMLNMVIATIAAFYYVRDFNDKSIHHVLMSGYSRKEIVCSKTIAFNIETAIAFLVYMVSAMSIIFALKGIKLSSSCNYSVFVYIIITFSFKLLYLIALNSICMCFCYLVRSAVAYLIVILSLWASFLGPIYKFDFVKNNILLKNILKLTINVQDQIMFLDRIKNAKYIITVNDAVLFLGVVIVTILVFYKLTCEILDRGEIK